MTNKTDYDLHMPLNFLLCWLLPTDNLIQFLWVLSTPRTNQLIIFPTTAHHKMFEFCEYYSNLPKLLFINKQHIKYFIRL